jgi:hypothetical protein
VESELESKKSNETIVDEFCKHERCDCGEDKLSDKVSNGEVKEKRREKRIKEGDMRIKRRFSLDSEKGRS